MDIHSHKNKVMTGDCLRIAESAMSIVDGLRRLREDGIFCDVTLRVGEKKIRAHKNVISACSPYLKAVLDRSRDSSVVEIIINDVNPHHLESLIEYMYTGTLYFDYSNVKNFLLAATLLHMKSAEELCCSYLHNNLTLDNCVEYILFAGKHSISSLLSSSIEVAAINFHNIYFKNDYLEIEFKEFKQLKDKLFHNGYSQDLVFPFVMRWINHASAQRAQYFNNLLRLEELLSVSRDVLNCFKIENDLSPTFAALANNINRINMPYEILVSRRIGKLNALGIKVLSGGRQMPIEELPENIIDGSYVCYGHDIYHQGGWKNKKQLLTESYVYNTIINTWFPFVPLQQARAYHHSCVLDGRIYSVGGSNGLKAISSVEFADLLTGQRGFTAPLQQPKERAGLGIYENSIYVVGGCDRGKKFKCIHRFDAREGVWQELASSPYRAGASSCAVVGENIYTTHADALQRYDIRANDWTLIYGQYQRYPQEVFESDNRLFGLFSSHIAEFLPLQGKWKNTHALKFHLPYLQVSTKLRRLDIDSYDLV